MITVLNTYGPVCKLSLAPSLKGFRKLSLDVENKEFVSDLSMEWFPSSTQQWILIALEIDRKTD